MNERVAVPLALIFGIIAVLLVRSRDVKAWEAVMIALFGLYIGQTPFVFTINGLVTWVLSGFTRTH